MKTDDRNSIWRFWAGTGCAALWSWLASALIFFCSRGLADTQFAQRAAGWFVSLICLAWWLTSVFPVLFMAGAIASFFWHPLERICDLKIWGAWCVVIILAPLLLIDWLPFYLLICFAPLAILPFHSGLGRSAEWWRRRRYRHFFGLSNDWERDQNEPKSP